MMFSSADGRVESIFFASTNHDDKGKWRVAEQLRLFRKLPGHTDHGALLGGLVTLFSSETIQRFQSEANINLAPLDAGHNIITSGIDTDMLEATYFTIGDVELRGIGPTSGIKIPDEHRGNRRLYAAMRDSVGQIAEVISPGVVMPDAQIALGGLATALRRAA